MATVPVTLLIALNESGRIATPPQIVRPNGAMPDERRLISEARALAAVTACVPYHGPESFGAKALFTIRFR